MNGLKSVTRPLMWFMALLFAALTTGCGGGGGGSSGGIAPTVTAVAPLANATGVAINIKKITAAFSKAMDPASLTTASFTLACPAATPITGGVVTYMAASNTATLTLSAGNLPLNTLCTATITTGARDATSVALASNFVWNFTTGATADTTPPTVALTAPVDGVPGVATNTLVNATFSEDMDPATITGTNFTLVNTTAGGTAVAGSVSYVVSSRIATFTPTATLPVSTLFTATITTAVTDLAGNLMVANKVWTFTTGTTASASVIPGIAGTPGASTTDPTVNSTNPSNGAINVPTSTNGSNNVVTGKVLTATFSQAMNPATITPVGTFTLKETVAGTNVPGTVVMNTANTIATFTPTVAALTVNTFYTATVSTAAKNAGGTAMGNAVAWTFKTNATALTAQVPVNLLTAGNFAILANTAAITYNGTAGAPAVTGDVGLATLSSASFAGFAQALDATNDFATSIDVVTPGKMYAPDYTGGGAGANGLTPAKMVLAGTDMTLAYNDAAGRTAGTGTFLNAGSPVGTLDTLTLTPGVYTWGGNVISSAASNVTLSGGPNDVWIFQIGGYFRPGNGSNVTLVNPTGGALPQAKNIFWAVAGSDATLGTTAHMEGVMLTGVGYITLNLGATANSRLLAHTAVTLGGTVTQPAP